MPGMPDIERLCIGCMTMKPDALQPCPRCGLPTGAYRAVPGQLPPRAILNGRYLVGRSIGRNESGVTYIAYDLKRERRVAIREYFPKLYAQRQTVGTGVSRVVPLEGQQARFQKGLTQTEARANALIAMGPLPGIVAPQKLFAENGTLYFVTPYVRGITLRRHLDKNGGRLRPNEAFEGARAMMTSLAALHQAGITHGGITPKKAPAHIGGGDPSPFSVAGGRPLRGAGWRARGLRRVEGRECALRGAVCAAGRAGTRLGQDPRRAASRAFLAGYQHIAQN